MRRSRLYLILLISFLILASFYSLFPSIKLWSMSEENKEEIRNTEPQDLISLEQRAIKLGLDLKGGMHVVLQVDQSRLSENERKDAAERALEIIRNRVDQFGITEPLIHKQGADRIVVELPGLQDVERAQGLIGQTAQLEFKLLEDPDNTMSVLKKIDEVLAQAETTAAEEELFEPAEEEEEEKTDVVKDLFAEEEEPDTAEEDTAGFLEEEEEPFYEERPFTQYLEYTQGSSYFRVLAEEKPKVELLLGKPEVRELVPKDTEFAWSTRTEMDRGEEFWGLYLAKKRTELSGKYLVDARPRLDPQFRRPEVLFNLTKKGGRIFSRVTGANIDKPLAIMLDGRVESAPIIRSKIRDEGVIEMGGTANFEDASDLAIVLRAGALPAPVKIIENRVIGPSLGQDSIQKGTTAAIIGFLLVLLFMAFYYRLSGIIADVALLFNLTFLLAAMAALHATLTLPGIAGIILTIGMSVDANVLIFERIREELRTGKTIRAAIDAGYKRALLAIVDAHVTTLITAAVLFQFGTGPVKGFAVALSLGVAISLFTAVVITRVIFDIRKGYRTLSI
ncbi:MAG: protein translocase subunit SecD [Deltaproteobacteria bacterium]|nr:protein translocase subunit SecD [Deltaproteobacteria bacterium]